MKVHQADMSTRRTNCNTLFQNELKDTVKIMQEMKDQQKREFEKCSHQVTKHRKELKIKEKIFSEMKTKLEGI